MLDASLIVLIGFIIFITAALRFGYRKSLTALDEKINQVKDTLSSAYQRKKDAEEELTIQKQIHKNIKREIEELTQQTQLQIEEINNQASLEIERLFANRQNNFELQLERIRNNAIEHLNTTITDMAVSTLTTLIKDLPEKTHEAINDQQVDEFEQLLLSNSNGNNGGRKKPSKKTEAA